MGLRDSPPKLLVCHVGSEAFAPWTCTIMSKLGYRLLTPEEFEVLAGAGEAEAPQLLVVDERNLGEVPEAEAPVPIILVTGRYGATGADPRIAGAVLRPVGLHEFYRLVQEVLEEHPRSVPRVATHLRATCRLDDKEWGGWMLSLSENGGLLRSPEPIPLGTRLSVAFELPRAGALELEAFAGYQLVPDVGLTFSATPAGIRSAIACYVADLLLEPRSAAGRASGGRGEPVG